MTPDSEIRYSPHFNYRHTRRLFPEGSGEAVLQNADAHYYDTLRRRFVAVKRMFVLGAERNVALAYEIEDNITRLVTILPLKEGQQRNRMQRVRWVPYEPESKL